ncbi:MAG: hypothetical protein GX853_07245 [Chloroflexi bacterium]|jgi:hypothetical protein|nr:hypothetical protein [Chloroflexota bacterium]
MNENNQKYAYSDEQAHSFDTPAHDPYNYESNWYASQDRPQESKMPVHRAALLGVLAAVVVILIGLTVFLLLNDRQRNTQIASNNAFMTSHDNPSSEPLFSGNWNQTDPSQTPKPQQSSTQAPQTQATPTPTQPEPSNNQVVYTSQSYESIETYKTPVRVINKPVAWCPETVLQVGDYAFVNPPTGHASIRKEATGRVSPGAYTMAYPGAIFRVLEGPICDENTGVNLFRLQTTWDKEGWSVEAPANLSEWWLLPIHTRKVCQDAKLPTRLLVGMKAFVLEEPYDPVEVYYEPSISGEHFYQINPTRHDITQGRRLGTETFVLLEGPHCDGKGANWWKVRLNNGKEGWLRESSAEHNYYYIGPYYE